ncbi:MAG: 50S ribosomal protein L1 [Chlamydiia bacterium]|nr:50S ribosomal protein L1 [Chlamydiia bacterium]
MKSKRGKKISNLVDTSALYSLENAVDVLKECPAIKFIETIDLAINLGIDPRKAEQQVRGTVTLPNGKGKKVRIVAIVSGENAKIAKEEGADFVGDEDIAKKILAGWTDFDVVISTPDMMRVVGTLGRKLGPQGLMPSPKGGTLVSDVKKAISEFKKGKCEIKSNRHGSVHVAVGRVNMESGHIIENITAVLKSVIRMKPATASGKYVQSLYISSTMGPGIKLDIEKLIN